jgi:hypothetical protein
MGGFLFFGRNFRVNRPWVDPTAEDFDTHDLSYTRLAEMVNFGETIGIPRDLWSDFVNQDDFDGVLPVGEVAQKSRKLRELVASLPTEQIRSNEALSVVADHLARGLDVFFWH